MTQANQSRRQRLLIVRLSNIVGTEESYRRDWTRTKTHANESVGEIERRKVKKNE
jgi:hypothetical protein